MNSKLTLKLDTETIEAAKRYADYNKTSLSKLIEYYFQSVTKKRRKVTKIDPLVKELSGIIKLPRGFDYKKEYGKYVLKKYSK